MSLKKKEHPIRGTIVTGVLPQTDSLKSVVLEGNVLTISYSIKVDGKTIDLKIEVTVEGDAFKGNATMEGTSESFPVIGKKVPKF